MSYRPVYVRYLGLPRISDDVLQAINYEFDQYQSKGKGDVNPNYIWSDSFNAEVNHWCQRNICEDMYFAFQIIRGDLVMHKDEGTKIKLIYLLETGGDHVATEFWNDDRSQLLQSEILQAHRWHVMKVDVNHRVVGVEPGKIRFSITGRVFE